MGFPVSTQRLSIDGINQLQMDQWTSNSHAEPNSAPPNQHDQVLGHIIQMQILELVSPSKHGPRLALVVSQLKHWLLLHPASAEGVIVLALCVCLCVCPSVCPSHSPGKMDQHTNLNSLDSWSGQLE